MTELAARLPLLRGPRRALQALAVVVGVALVAVGVFELRPHAAATVRVRDVAPHKRPSAHESAVPAVRPVHATRLSARLGEDAARAFDRGFFTSSPGGIVATAARVARWRPLVVRAVRGSGFGPNLLEALVFVESSGRPDVIAGGDVSSPAGLTQITASTGKRVLHLHVNVSKSRRLTHRIYRAEARGSYVQARQLRRWRSRYDARFAPAKTLRAMVRYLAIARRRLGRADLAVEAYEMGIGKLRRAIATYPGEGAPSYAQLYFGSAPDEHRGTWRRLAPFGDYYWKILAAKRVMRLYRRDPAALVFEARQQVRKNSSEEVMHPRYRTARFGTPNAIARAWRHHVLRAIPRAARRTHIAIGPSLGEQARELGRSRRLYRGLRPAALEVLLYIGRRVHEISGARKPLLVTSAVRDNRYQRMLTRVNANAARTYSLHTTGYAVDIARSYASRRQAAAFQFVLDRLQAVNAIAYIREAAAIHIAVASDAPTKLKLLARVVTSS